jgi:signal transduction histidine kinase
LYRSKTATIVKLNIELLQKYIDSNPEEFKKYLDRMSSAVETEIGLINTLLTSAKLEGDKVEIKYEKVNIKESIEMAIHGQEKDLKEGVSINTNIERNLPYAYADKIRVAEVLNNLIGNAIKYTERGSITISAKSEGTNITINVKDTGKGISKEDMEKLGEKFYRVDNYLESDIVRPGGSGLGLYVSFGLVRLMGSKIEVKSEVGMGSTFSFTLPQYTNQIIDSTDTIDRFQILGLKK